MFTGSSPYETTTFSTCQIWNYLPIAFHMTCTCKLVGCLFRRLENFVVKGENAGYQHFLLLPQCFPNPFSVVVIKTLDNREKD